MADAPPADHGAAHRHLWPLTGAVSFVATLFGMLAFLWLVLFITKGRFLEEPFERWASAELGQPVEVAGDFQLYSEPHIKFVAEGLTAGNPDWAINERFAEAEFIDLRIDIFRALFGSTLIRRATLRDARFALEWNEDHSANTWSFGADEGDAEPFALPRIRRADIEATSLAYRDPQMELEAEIDFAPARARDSRFESAIAFDGDGSSRGAAFTVEGTLNSPNETVAGGRNELAMRIGVGDSRIDVSGTLPGVTELEGAKLAVHGRGSNLATPFRLLAIAVPETRRYDLKGDLTKAGDEWRLTGIGGTFGDSDLAGRMTVRTGAARVFVDADLNSETLDILDAGPWIGISPGRLEAEGGKGAITQEGGRPRVLPDAPLDSEGLARLDARIDYTAGRVRTGTVPITGLEVALRLDDRHLQLEPVRFDFAGGTLSANIDLDARQSPVRTVYNINLSPVRLADLLTGFDIEASGTTGTMRARIDLTGHGDSVRESLGSASGRAAFVLPRGSLWLKNAELLELDIGDFVEAAISDDLKEPAAIRCGLIAFTFEKGVGRSDPIFIDTEKAVLRGGGTVNLRDESLNLAVEADSKNFSLFSGQSPIGINGYLAAPTVNPVSGELLGRIATGTALGAVLTPLAALVSFIDLGDEEDTNCQPVLAGARGAEVKAADEAAEN